MDTIKYFRDLTKELRAVQNRIRNLIGSAHWPSDGAWKESVLRSLLRRYLPPSYTVGSGFILTPEGPSTQIDLLVCDDSAPIVFRDGDLLIATAGCVRAAVEVKTRLTPADLTISLNKLNATSALLRPRPLRKPFLGLFSYESIGRGHQDILDSLNVANGDAAIFPITALSFGQKQFFRFWETEPGIPQGFGVHHNAWHAYNLPAIAPGYFIHNVVESIFPEAVRQDGEMWYPRRGKEQFLVAQRVRGGGQLTA